MDWGRLDRRPVLVAVTGPNGSGKSMLKRLPLVLVYDNTDLANPYRLVATAEKGHVVLESGEVPEWFRSLVET